jgi:type VI secretion system Hcp family effector
MNIGIFALLLGLSFVSPNRDSRADGRPAGNDSRPAIRHSNNEKYYVAFKGSKQGQFKGEMNTKDGHETEGWFNVARFDLGGENPIESTGAAHSTESGRRRHEPVTLTRYVDAASPKLWTARQGAEQFSSVTIKAAITQKGREDEEYTITLTNAQIIKLETKNGTETIQFTYDEMTRRK